MLTFASMLSDQRPIGVFDSGIGGLTVLRHLLSLLPHEHFVYLGDTARVPYGNKSAETIQRYARECTNFLTDQRVKLIVVACNTASALALDYVRAHTDVPIVGMIQPAALDAVQTSASGRIGVIGTRATIASNAYGVAIHDIVHECRGRYRFSVGQLELVSRACPLFVPLVEEGWIDSPATQLIAQSYLKPLTDKGIDTLVLGCTHYPLLWPLISLLAPGVTLIDCGMAAARQAHNILDEIGERNTDSTVRTATERVSVYVTDNTPSFTSIAKEFLGMPVQEPVRTALREIR